MDFIYITKNLLITDRKIFWILLISQNTVSNYRLKIVLFTIIVKTQDLFDEVQSI